MQEIMEERQELLGRGTVGFKNRDGAQYAYIYRNGVNIFDEQYSYVEIHTFVEGKYYTFIRLPVSNAKMALEFIDEIHFDVRSIF